MTGQGCLLPVDWNEKRTTRKFLVVRRFSKPTLLVIGVLGATGLVDLPVNHPCQKSFPHLYRINTGRLGWCDDLGSDHDTRRLNFSSLDMSDHNRASAGYTNEWGQRKLRGLGFTRTCALHRLQVARPRQACHGDDGQAVSAVISIGVRLTLRQAMQDYAVKKRRSCQWTIA